MREVRESEPETWFPQYGARARRWNRFERDLREWLETPEGRFAEWRARTATHAAEPDADRRSADRR